MRTFLDALAEKERSREPDSYKGGFHGGAMPCSGQMPGGKMYCYCIFCKTAKEQSLADMLEKELGCRVLIVRQLQCILKKGKRISTERVIFPGYLFLYTNERLEPKSLSDMKYRFSDIIRMLMGKTDEYQTGELTGGDKQFALKIYERNGILGKLKVYEQNGVFYPAGEMEDSIQILKADRRKGRMQICLQLSGKDMKTWVEYELEEVDGNRKKEDAEALL